MKHKISKFYSDKSIADFNIQSEYSVFHHMGKFITHCPLMGGCSFSDDDLKQIEKMLNSTSRVCSIILNANIIDDEIMNFIDSESMTIKCMAYYILSEVVCVLPLDNSYLSLLRKQTQTIQGKRISYTLQKYIRQKSFDPITPDFFKLSITQTDILSGAKFYGITEVQKVQEIEKRNSELNKAVEDWKNENSYLRQECNDWRHKYEEADEKSKRAIINQIVELAEGLQDKASLLVVLSQLNIKYEHRFDDLIDNFALHPTHRLTTTTNNYASGSNCVVVNGNITNNQ